MKGHPSSTSTSTSNAAAVQYIVHCESIEVMTFNIRGSFRRQDGINVWKKRRNCNISLIEKHNPDIIGFQEAQAGNFKDYASCSLGIQYDFVVGHVCKRSMDWNIGGLQDCWEESSNPLSALWGAGNHLVRNIGSSTEQNEHCPIYFKRSKFDLLQSGAFYLSETPDVESVSWASKLPRAATWVRLRAKETKADFLVLNTHFPHENDEMTRAECSRVILQQLSTLAATDIPIVILGDFNCHASLNTLAYATFKRNGFQDTFVDSNSSSPESAKAEVNTFHHFRGEDCPWNLGRIDWILLKSETPSHSNGHASISFLEKAKIIRDAEPPLYPSDHYPVVATLQLSKSK